MIFSQDRDQLRITYFQAWKKARANQPLEPLERDIVQVIAEHPEYHALLEDEEAALDQDFSPEAAEVNPFLHMGLHLAIREQIATDRPQGIQKAHRRLGRRRADPHVTEHCMMECLVQMIWDSQHFERMPDEAAYLQCIRKLSK